MKFEYKGEDIYWHFTDAEIDILKKQKHLAAEVLLTLIMQLQQRNESSKEP